MCLTTAELPPEQRGPSGGMKRMIAPSVLRRQREADERARAGAVRLRVRTGEGQAAGRGRAQVLEKGDPGGRCRCQASGG